MISLTQAEQVHKILIGQFGGAFGVRDSGALASALSRPFQTFEGKELYPTVIQKGASLIESILINHPFVDGSIRSFGDTETNDITVCFDNKTDKVEELSCRVDMQQIDKHFIEQVLSLATQFECLLMDRQGRLFEPTITALGETIQLSNAKRFVTDPRQFLEDLSVGIVTPE